MRVAIVHDWLDTWRGGEEVLAELLRVFPAADLFALVDFMGEDDRKRLGGRRAATSFLQHMPFARRHFRSYLPLFPHAIESLDCSRYDLVLSSSHAVAKGVRTRPGQPHVCYCYTPMRYAWDLQEQYLAQTGLSRGLRSVAVRAVLRRLRTWDRASSARVTHFVAISRHIAARIKRSYDRDATVIYPPIHPSRGTTVATAREPTYVTVSQLVPYKRIDVMIDAFGRSPERTLLVIGEGPERRRLQARAGANVRFAGRLADRERDEWLSRAKAFLFTAEEDFGIAPLEAQAAGTPVIAYRGGAASETIRDIDTEQPSGVLFDHQSAESLLDALDRFERMGDRIRAEACMQNAARFAPERFRREIGAFVADVLSQPREQRGGRGA